MTRPFRPSDEAILRNMHAAQGFDYPFPHLTSDEFVSVMVAVDENDMPVQAVAARKTVEVYFLGDAKWRTPVWRFNVLSELHAAVWGVLRARGYRDVHAWVPPQIAQSFGSRLRKTFGWIPSHWQCFVKYL